MTRQSVAGFECELLRRGYTVIQTKERYNVTDDSWRYGIKDVFTYQITKGNVDDELSTNYALVQYYFMYRPIEDNDEIYNVIIQNSDIVVFDHGLHWSPDYYDEYQPAMNQLVNAYSNSNKKLKIIAWRETSAQHYDRVGGFYYENGIDLPPLENEQGKTPVCIPIVIS